MLAASKGHEGAVRYLVEQGWDKHKANHEGVNSLMIAAQQGHLQICRYLVEQGVDKERACNRGQTRASAAQGHFRVVEFLLEDGVDLTKATTDSATALHFAAQRGHAEIVSILMAYGASLTARTTNGRLPIDMAVEEAIRVLIHDEPSRRIDHGRKRAVIPDSEVEQDNKRPRLQEEGKGQSSAPASAPLTAEELAYEEEVNGDSASSDEDEIDE